MRSAKGAAARRQTTEELYRSSGGELNTVPVLRVFLEKMEVVRYTKIALPLSRISMRLG